MGIREWMIFPDDVREKLLDMDYVEWPAHIQRAIPNYGRTMAASARIAFEKGLIDRRNYLMLASSVGGSGST